MSKLYSVNLYKIAADFDGTLVESLEGQAVVKKGLFAVKDIFERKRYHILNDTNQNSYYGRIIDLYYDNYDIEEDDIFSELECFCGFDVEDQDYELFFVKRSDLRSRNVLDENDIEQLALKPNPPRELIRAYTKAKRR